jgi:hypothetical protein
MCQRSEFITLTETEEAQITWCKSCKTFSLSYKCCCASFTEKELVQFCDLLEGLEDADFHYEFSGLPHTIIKNPCSLVGFCLSKNDTKELVKLSSEALTLFAAFRIIYN